MITRQHTALSLMAYTAKGNTLKMFRQELPWNLLPDGIRAYSGPRQMSHFEQLPDGTDNAWMMFPNEVTLKGLSKETLADSVTMYLPDGYPKCVIGENTNLDLFDKKNYGHRHYHALRIHMVQDIILDDVLREQLVRVDGRFKDQFIIRWNNQEIDGVTLRKQVALFESLGFIHLAGRVYECTGVVLNNKWLTENVLGSLNGVYPEDLAANTFKYIVLSDEEDTRITELRFDLTDEEKAGFILCDPKELEEVLDDMYARAFYFSTREL